MPALGLAACEAVPQRPQAGGALRASAVSPARSLASPGDLAARMPEEAAGFVRGTTAPLARREGGQEIGYRTLGRTAAGATVELYRLPDTIVPEGTESPAAAAAFDQLMQDAASQLPHRRLEDAGQFTLPAPGPGLLRCAETTGVYGRTRVAGLLCAGGVAGGLLRLRVTMPQHDPMPADARAFAAAILAALRTP